jgi:hypothetical protein
MQAMEAGVWYAYPENGGPPACGSPVIAPGPRILTFEWERTPRSPGFTTLEAGIVTEFEVCANCAGNWVAQPASSVAIVKCDAIEFLGCMEIDLLFQFLKRKCWVFRMGVMSSGLGGRQISRDCHDAWIKLMVFEE